MFEVIQGSNSYFRSFIFFVCHFSLLSLCLYSSGLSFEESKELTKADLNQESARSQSPSHLMVPAADAPECTKDSSQTAAAAVVKDMKPTQEPLKPQPAQKEPVFTTEPMKTRRSQYAEERKLSTTTAQSAPTPAVPTPAVTTPEVEREAKQDAVGTLPENELKKEEKTELPQKSHPPMARPELKEEPESAVRPTELSKEVISEPTVPSEALKRKSISEIEGEFTPEKRPRMSSLSSVSSVSPPASSTSSPLTPTLTTNQKVPPLKVGNVCELRMSSHLFNMKKAPLINLKSSSTS